MAKERRLSLNGRMQPRRKREKSPVCECTEGVAKRTELVGLKHARVFGSILIVIIIRTDM